MADRGLPKGSFWDSKSPITLGLILVLIVTVPYILGVMGILVYYSVSKPAPKAPVTQTTTRPSNISNYSTVRTVTIRTTKIQSVVKSTTMPTIVNETKLNATASNVTVVGNATAPARRSFSSGEMTAEGECDCSKVWLAESCPTFYMDGEEARFPFVAALSEITFMDSPQEYRYKCSGVVVNKYLFLTSTECVQVGGRSEKDYLVRAGSNYWSYLGSVHEVQEIIFPNLGPDKYLVLIKVKEPFPNIQTIQDVTMSTTDLKSVDDFTWIRWDNSFTTHSKARDKYEHVLSSPMFVSECSNTQGLRRFTICGVEQQQLTPCSEYYHTSGNPIFDHNMNLLGMQIKSKCNFLTGLTEHYFTGMHAYVKWIERMKIKYSY